MTGREEMEIDVWGVPLAKAEQEAAIRRISLRHKLRSILEVPHAEPILSQIASGDTRLFDRNAVLARAVRKLDEEELLELLSRLEAPDP